MNGIRLEFSNAWKHSKFSFEKNSISMSFGSTMEWEEKRFVYHIRCSSDENNDPEGMEGGIGASCDPECRWLRLEVPFRFFYGSAIWRVFSGFQSDWKKMKFGLCGEWFGLELSEIWLKEKLEARVFEREKGCRFQNLKFEYIGAGTHRNQLHKYGNRLPESNIAINNCL